MSGSSPIRKDQTKKIRGLAAYLFSGDDEYHAWLSDNFGGISSTLDLTEAKANEALRLLRRMAAATRRQYAGAGKKGRAAGRITDAQARKIGALEFLLGWENDRTRLLGFIRRQTGQHCDVQMLLNYQAQKVITGMQRIAADGDDEMYRFLNRWKPNTADPSGRASLIALRKRLKIKEKR